MYGRLGNNSTTSSEVFVKSLKYTNGSSGSKEAITGATQISCGSDYTAAIINGEVWQCGWNVYGQLGNTTVASGWTASNNYSSVFVKSYKSKDGSYLESPSGDNTEAITGAIQISYGYCHTAVLLNNGEVWQCGSNSGGQLGINTIKESSVFVQSRKSNSGDYLENPSNSTTTSITGVTQIACGGYHTAVLLNNGEVWQVGSNGKGQLGNTSVIPKTDLNGSRSETFIKSYKSKDGNYLESPSGDNTEAITGAIQISCGYWHTAVLLNNGKVWQCGHNQYGQLGNTSVVTGEDANSAVFVQSSNITGAMQVACGYYNTTAICEENTKTISLYGVGQNDKGQLGLGDDAGTDNVLTFTKSTTIGYIGSTADIDTIVDLGKSNSRDASGAGQFVGGYRLDVEWSDLQYTYTAEWNIEDSKWVGAWEAADGGDQIVVKNGSATPCKVEFNFNANDEFKSPSDGEPGTKGTFTDPNVAGEPVLDTTTNTVPLAVYTATTQATSQKTVKLGLEGIPNEKAGTNIETPTTVGSVTVTLKNADS